MTGGGLQRLHPVIVHHLVNSLGWQNLRPLQERAAAPVLDGADALLLAPTAGGKTEAAVFPLLTAMERERWSGLSVVYVCPLKALLNNLLPRLETYTSWLGRRTAVWHGDVPASARQRILQLVAALAGRMARTLPARPRLRPWPASWPPGFSDGGRWRRRLRRNRPLTLHLACWSAHAGIRAEETADGRPDVRVVEQVEVMHAA